MLQMLKSFVYRTLKMCVAVAKALLKMCIAILKILLITGMFAAMVFGGLSGVLAVGPQQTPSWMAPAWETLNTVDPVRLSSAINATALPQWDARDSSVMIGKWVAQMSPGASLLATFVGLAEGHFLRTQVELSIQQLNTLVKAEPKVGQAVCAAWIVSTFSILSLVLRILIGTVRLGGRCVRRVARAVCPARAAITEAASVVSRADGTGPTPKHNIAQVTQALGENTSVNIVPSTLMTDEKKGGRKRVSTPVTKTIQAKVHARKEDVPPSVASPVRRKFSELNELREQGIVNRRLYGY